MSNIHRAVMVGCGGMSAAWLNAAKDIPNVEIVGLVDLNIDSTKQRKEKFELSNAVCGTDIAKVIRESNADVVFDCTIPEAHCDVTVTALNNNCHILGEKPMADSIENAKKMLKASKDNDKLYAVIQNRRYLDNIIKYKKLIDTKEIGELTTLNADFYMGIRFSSEDKIDFRDKMDHVLLLDMAIHSFDEARFISGKDPISVYCHSWNPKGSWYAHGASAQVIFEMSDGMVFNYRGSWCADGLSTSWECEWRAIGTKGTAKWDGHAGVTGQVSTGENKFSKKVKDLDVVEPAKLELEGHKALIAEFIRCIDTGEKPQTICTDNIKSLQMVHSAIESANTGKKVMIQPL